MKRFTGPLLFSTSFVVVMALRATLTTAQAPAPGPAVDYNWDVKPILSDNCFRCHGPDEKSRRAGLRLDNADSAYAALSGRTERHAIVPGDVEHSELVKRITADTPAVRMPPASTNKTLTPQQIDTLKQWIVQGAKYKPPWASIAPTGPANTEFHIMKRGPWPVGRYKVAISLNGRPAGSGTFEVVP